MSYQLTEPAARDIENIIRETLQTFGARQVEIYGRIIERGLDLVGDAPDRPGSLDRSEVADGVRLFHLELAAGRRGAAAHCLYYTTGRLSDGRDGTIILRVLHEHMEPRHKVVRSLKDLNQT